MQGSKKLRRVAGLGSDTLQVLEKCDLHTCKDVLGKSTPFDLFQTVDLPLSRFNALIRSVSQAVAPEPRLVSDLFIERKRAASFFKTSMADLDRTLRGGLAFSTITEIVGPSGSGKTQFCMMLAIQAALTPQQGGLGSSVIYIDTESAFSASRLAEMARAKHPSIFATDTAIEALMAKINVCYESTCEGLFRRLETLEELIISTGARLVILDSVASLVRKEFDSASMIARTDYLAKEAAVLKYLAESFTMPIVVTNQVTTTFQPSQSDPDSNEGEMVEGQVTAALGNSWSHSVNTRLIIEYRNEQFRNLKIAKSPVAPYAVFAFQVCASGLVLVDGASDREPRK